VACFKTSLHSRPTLLGPVLVTWYHRLYLKLMKREVPKCFLNLLINWYSRGFAFVRWNDAVSRMICMTCGVRPVCLLSPVLFAISVDDIANSLSSSKLGCYVGGMYVG